MSETYRDIINGLSNKDLANILVNGDILNMACIDYDCHCNGEDEDEMTCEGCILKLLEREVDEDNPLVVR